MKINVNSAKFLDKEKDITHKDVITLKSEGQWNQSKKYTKEDGTPSNQFDIEIELGNGEDRMTTLSYTNLKLLVDALGDESSNWIGTTLRAWKTKSERAKTGFVFFFVPTDWERDDIGEWILPKKVERTSDGSEMPNFDIGE